MAKLNKRSYRFSRLERKAFRKLNGFTMAQRVRKTLDADAKPQHGVSQPMPPRGGASAA